MGIVAGVSVVLVRSRRFFMSGIAFATIIASGSISLVSMITLGLRLLNSRLSIEYISRYPTWRPF